jgi:cysteine-rich repeat protein
MRILLLLAVLAAACGENVEADPCGNGMLDPGEDCDDGNASDDDDCSTLCYLICGDGVKGANEACDTGIAAGQPGACLKAASFR